MHDDAPREQQERRETMTTEAMAWTSAPAQFRWIKHPILGVWRGGVFAISECSATATDARDLARVAKERQLAWLYLHEEHEPVIDLVRDLDQEKFRACPARVVRGDPHVWGYFETSIDQERCRYCDVAKQEGRHQ